jgi:RimJ/RimL family protein N-acetyltransferase
VYVWFTQTRERFFRYGIQIDEAYRKKGYAAEALVIVLDYYFNELNYQKCCPTAYEFNKRSQAFHERFGFVKEGVLRNEVFTRGKYYSMVYYGLLRDEFNAKYKHWEV